MKRIGLLLITVLLVNTPNTIAQSINLSGKVVDSQSNAISSLKVTLEGRAVSTSTDALGEFNINNVGIDTRHAQSDVYFDGEAIYFSLMGPTHIYIYEITGRLLEKITLSNWQSGKYFFYPSAYLPEDGIKMYIVTINSESGMHSFKVLNMESRQFKKGIMYAYNSLIQPNLLFPSLKSSGSIEEYNYVDRLIFEHESYERRIMELSSYTADLGTISMDDILTIPNAPSGLVASAISETQINISWNDDSDNETGFEIERSTDNTNSWSQITTVGSNIETYENTDLSSNTTYYYRIRAYNSAGNSNYSNSASAQTHLGLTQPASASSLTVEATSPTSCNLNWTDESSNETGFIIERQHLTISGNWEVVDYVGENITTYTHTGINETWPAYRIIAYADLNSGPSNVASAPAKLRIVNDLYNVSTMETYNQLVRVRIGPTEASVTSDGSYERLEPSETVYDISTVNTIYPGYTSANSSLYYEDYSVEEAWNYSDYWVYIQCGWWDYIVVLGPPYYWQKTMTIALCSDGVSECYKAAWVNIYNHYSGYFVLQASDLLPHINWGAKKSSNSNPSIDAKTWNNK